MAVLLNITYQKKLGLPNFSSHSCSVSVQVEVSDLSQVAEQNARLYKLLQSSVDEEIKKVGYMPDATSYGMNGGQSNGNGHHQRQPQQQNGDSGISEKQLDLINRVVRENNVNKTEVENMAVEFYGGGVRTLHRTQASNFIDELFIKYGRRNGATGSGASSPRRQSART